ncbi:MAG: phosphatase PAP2 family protein [Chloroflexi bacterium]|nr:phosphatase PAP2 family protein [Chloroflexota bacterium]
MGEFVDAIRVHTPGNAFEAVLLAAVLLIAFLAFRRVAGLATGVMAAGIGLGAFVQIGHPSIPMAIALAGLLLARSAPATGRTHSWLPFARQLAAVFAGFILYEIARFNVVAERAPAVRNATRVVDFEKALGSFFEPDLQRVLTSTGWLTHTFNAFYSHGFLAVVAGAILWLYFASPERYRLYRNALGLSTVLAIVLIAFFPTAPPRLFPALGIEDTVVQLGREHSFANEYAAIPSLHVGWLSLTGYVLALPYSRWRFWAIALLPGLAMQTTVIVTGNHYWIDGVIGTLISVGPALALRHWRPLSALPRRAQSWLASHRPGPAGARRVQLTVLTLGGLFLYLGVAQFVRPGFTDFWGYLFFQVGATVFLLVAGEFVFSREGGLSGLTHIIAIVCSFADVLGTDGNLYARIDEYDKITHFMGTAAITAGIYDILHALSIRRGSTRPAVERLYLAVAIGIAAGIAWEVYEYLGDRVFHTTRTQGRWDTFNDLVSDTLGAFTLGMLLWWQERTSAAPVPSEEAYVPPPGGG